MKSIIVSSDNESKKLKKFLQTYLRDATEGFIYKMLRKKNILLNEKKADGSEVLKCGDVVSIYFSDETIEKFRGTKAKSIVTNKIYKNNILDEKIIVYEDSNIIIINKPQGILSQKSTKKDLSINEMALNYMLKKKEIDEKSLNFFVPSVMNRLDRNTGGLIIFAKNYKIAKAISTMFNNNQIQRFYTAICYKNAKKVFANRNSIIVTSSYIKNKFENIVDISNLTISNDTSIEMIHSQDKNLIATKFTLIKSNEVYSVIEAMLLTGKSHQIRAQLFKIGLPIVGEIKYINSNDIEIVNIKNRYFKEIKHQLLFATKIIFNTFDDEFSYLNNKNFSINIPNRNFTLN